MLAIDPGRMSRRVQACAEVRYGHVSIVAVTILHLSSAAQASWINSSHTWSIFGG